MNQIFRPALLFLIGVIALPFCAVSQSPLPSIAWQEQVLDDGIIWKHAHTEALFNGWQNLNILEVNPKKHRFGLAYVTDTLLPTSLLAAQAGALAAVNAGFFNMSEGGSVTLLKVNGQVVNNTQEKLISEKSEILKGALVLGPGKKVRVEAAGPDNRYQSKKYPAVLLTGPLLLTNGLPVELAKRPFNDNRHPRTCACVTGDKKVLLLTADGRSNQAFGLALPELTALLQKLGCKEAVNLDGGGSTTMWIKGMPDNGVVNMPSDNKKFDHFGERKVANAVLVY